MTFWSSQTLEENLARLTDHPDKDMVDCNALTLRVGPEVYVTPGLEQAFPSTHTRQMLETRGSITVPPGQFAFLLTEEKITIPPEVMGFADKQQAFRDEVAGLKERQNRLLLYFAIAAVFAGALVGVVTKFVVDRLLPSAVAANPPPARAISQLPVPASPSGPVRLAPDQPGKTKP